LIFFFGTDARTILRVAKTTNKSLSASKGGQSNKVYEGVQS